MLRRRDLKGQDENAEAQAPSDQETQTSPQVTSPTANITPGGLAWKPMRQTNEEWRPTRTETGLTGDESVIGTDDFFNGNYKSQRGVRVQGRVEGSIESQGHIFIEQEAQVMADMAAEDITVAGRYNGKVECRRRFEITPTGVVTGEINTDLLVVQEGGYFDGKLKMKERTGVNRTQQAGGNSRGNQNAPAKQQQSNEEQTPAQV